MQFRAIGVLMAALTYKLKKYLKFITKKNKTKVGVVCKMQAKVPTALKTALYDLKSLFLSTSFFTNHNFNPKEPRLKRIKRG